LRKRDYGGLATVYFIAQLKFTDGDAYNRYQAAFTEVFQRYWGHFWRPMNRRVVGGIP
jgi:uncharacterized protein (DUF1330 family)